MQDGPSRADRLEGPKREQRQQQLQRTGPKSTREGCRPHNTAVFDSFMLLLLKCGRLCLLTASAVPRRRIGAHLVADWKRGSKKPTAHDYYIAYTAHRHPIECWVVYCWDRPKSKGCSPLLSVATSMQR